MHGEKETGQESSTSQKGSSGGVLVAKDTASS